MSSSVFVALTYFYQASVICKCNVLFFFLLNLDSVQSLQITAIPSSIPEEAVQGASDRKYVLTVSCTARGMPGIKNVTFLRITFRRLLDNRTPEEEIGFLSMGSDSENVSHYPGVVGHSGNLSIEEPWKAYLSLDLRLESCERAGQYRCYMTYFNDRDESIVTDPPVSSNVSAPRRFGPMTLTVKPVGKIHSLASKITLTCKGSVGFDLQKVDVAWQWAAVDSEAFKTPSFSELNFTDFVPTEWDEVLTRASYTSSTSTTSKCRTTRFQSTLVRMLTEADRFRTYRCYPVLDGARHLAGRSASLRIFTELASLKMSIYPQKLELKGEMADRYAPLTILCREENRPMDLITRVRIQLSHNQAFLATVEDGVDEEYSHYSSANGAEDDDKSESVNENKRCVAPITKIAGDKEVRDSLGVDWSPDLIYNSDVESDQMMYLSLTTYNVSCHSGGWYSCRFSYTLAIENAKPVTLSQTTDAFLPVTVYPRCPTMTVQKELLQYQVNTAVSLTCKAFIGNSISIVNWVWKVCRHRECSPLDNKRASVKRSEPIYNSTSCQYQQSTTLNYRFQEADKGLLEIRCVIMRNGSSYLWAARNFSVADIRASSLHGDRSLEMRHDYQYKNFLTSFIIPLTPCLGIVIFLLIGFDVTWKRYQRIQRRLYRTVYRKNRNRTDHFRKKRQSHVSLERVSEKSPRPTPKESFQCFLRIAYSVIVDKTELEVEGEEKKLHEPQNRPPSKRRQKRNGRHRKSRTDNKDKKVETIQRRSVSMPTLASASTRARDLLDFRPHHSSVQSQSTVDSLPSREV